MNRALTSVALFATLIAGCSGGSSKSSAGTDDGVVTAQSTADKIGCTGFQAEAAADREMFVADSGTCDLDGHTLTVYRFSNTETRDNWIKVATKFGVGRFVVFDRGVVTSDDQSSADAVKDKVGGDIRTS